MKMEQTECSEKSAYKLRRRGITQKKACNIQDTAKVWNQENFLINYKILSAGMYLQGTDTLQACCLVVSGLAGVWRDWDFKQQQGTYLGGRTNLPPPKRPPG